MEVVMIEDDDERETTVVETKTEKGFCKVCGNPARSLNGTVCDDHDGRRKGGNSGGSSTTKKSRTGAKGKAPDANEWTNKVFGKLLVGLTFLMAIRMVNQRGIKDPDDELADRLSMTKEEAASIASPLGRFIAPTGINKRYGRSVVDNIDIIDAAFAFYDWQQRVTNTLDQLPKNLAMVRTIKDQGDSTNVENEQAPSGNEYGSGTNANVTGEHFVF